MSERLIVLGDRTAIEVVEAAELAWGGRFESIERLYFDPRQFFSEDVPRYATLGDTVNYIVGVAGDKLKQEIVAACDSVGWTACSVVHPTAVVSPSAQIGAGVFVGPVAVVSSHAVVESHALVHLHASVGHDSHIGPFAVILPGARISGKVKVGARALVGSNAFVGAGTTVGEDARVDALCYVAHDVPAAHLISPRAAKAILRVDMR